MPLSSAVKVPHEMKTTTIRIISYHNKQLQGFLQNPHYQSDMYFDNCIQLIALLNNLLDSLNYPQEFVKLRSFFPDVSPKLAPVTSATNPKLTDKPPFAVFKLNILFRHNASWQGIIDWPEHASSIQFRSLLELIFILDSVLSV